MPKPVRGVFPGVLGKDYRLVSYGGKIYVVYSLPLRGGGTMEVSWRLTEEDAEAFNVKPGDITHVSANTFKGFQGLGAWAEVQDDIMEGEHPFKAFMRELRRQNRGVSWLTDDEFVGILVEGWAEQWDPTKIQNELQQTKWYRSRTDAQVAWEMDLSPADRRSQMKSWTQQVKDALQELYGADFNLKDAGITQANIKTWAENIASGKWGNPDQGFSFWLSNQQDKAEKVEGTPAWIGLQQQLEEQRAFANRPEDKFQALKEEAAYWLGPMGVPSKDTLKKWAANLVSGVASEADWTQYIQKQAKQLYPFLGANTPWQEFADPYKGIVEKLWGRPVDWAHPIMQGLGATDEGGAPTGGALGFHEFELLVRQDPQFWGGPVARDEGFQLYNYLNNVFRGVS